MACKKGGDSGTAPLPRLFYPPTSSDTTSSAPEIPLSWQVDTTEVVGSCNEVA